jgi:hypothetical protein
MLKPKVVGYIVAIYTLEVHMWDVTGFLLLLISNEKPLIQVNLEILLKEILYGVCLLSYLAGGVGLILFRHWAGWVVFLTTVVELTASTAGIVMRVSSFVINKQSDITIGSLVISGLPGVGDLVIPGIIAYMTLRLLRRPDVWKSSSITPKSKEAIHEHRCLAEKRRYRYVFWGIIITGAILPWFVGIAVKLHLDALAKSTLPWSYFINLGSLIYLAPFSVWFAIPYIILADIALNLLAKPRWGLASCRARLLFIGGGLVGGCVGTVLTFIEVFSHFDVLLIQAPVWIYYSPHMIGGLIVGYAVAKAV